MRYNQVISGKYEILYVGCYTRINNMIPGHDLPKIEFTLNFSRKIMTQAISATDSLLQPTYVTHHLDSSVFIKYFSFGWRARYLTTQKWYLCGCGCGSDWQMSKCQKFRQLFHFSNKTLLNCAININTSRWFLHVNLLYYFHSGFEIGTNEQTHTLHCFCPSISFTGWAFYSSSVRFKYLVKSC